MNVSVVELGMAATAAVAFAFVAEEWLPLVLCLLTAVLASRFILWRYSASVPAQRRTFSWVGVPFVLLSLFRMVSSRSAINTSLGIALLGTVYVFTCAVIELYRRPGQARPEVFHMGVMTVMMVAGISSSNRLYPVFLMLYFMLAVALLRHPFDGWWGRPALRRSRAPRAGTVLAFVLAMPLANLGMAAMPNAGRFLTQLYSQQLINSGAEESRLFGASSDLSSVQRMTASRAVVARVVGPNTTLRGQVFVKYLGGRWSAPTGRGRRAELQAQQGWITLPGTAPSSTQKWTIAPVKDVSGPVPLPSGAYRIQGFADLAIDPYDVLLGDAIDPYTVLASDRCDERSPTGIGAGSPEYRALPAELIEPLSAWAEPIVAGGDAAERLEKHLSEQGHYDPQARRSPGQDPVLAFLQGGLYGHCEMFASAMTLALRTRGIPTRYVVGFQLAEKNPWGGYYIVRDRDAHAWVEVYRQGHWQSFDPTPSAQFEATHPEGTQVNGWEGFSDGASGLLAATLSWLRRASLPGWVFPVVALLLLAWQAWRRPDRVAALFRRRPPAALHSLLLAQLERRLVPLGLIRRPQDTVLEFAARVEVELTPETGPPYREWLEQYVAMRFGGRELGGELAEALAALPRPALS